MELFFLAMLVVLMAFALGSGYPVAFALPGSAILTIGAAAVPVTCLPAILPPTSRKARRRNGSVRG
jgi:hypothetical protein